MHNALTICKTREKAKRKLLDKWEHSKNDIKPDMNYLHSNTHTKKNQKAWIFLIMI